MLTAAALAFLVNVAGAAFNWINQKAGPLFTQVFLFAVALAASAIWFYKNQIPGFWSMVQTAAIIFSLAVTFYEVLLKRIGFFSGPTPAPAVSNIPVQAPSDSTATLG